MELRVGPDITDFKTSGSLKATLLSLMGAGHPTSPTTPSLSRTSATSMFDVAAHPTVTRPCSQTTITGMGNLLPGVLGLFLMPCSETFLHRSCFQCCEEITRRTGNAKKHGTQRGDVPWEAGVCIDLGLFGVLRPWASWIRGSDEPMAFHVVHVVHVQFRDQGLTSSSACCCPPSHKSKGLLEAYVHPQSSRGCTLCTWMC